MSGLPEYTQQSRVMASAVHSVPVKALALCAIPVVDPEPCSMHCQNVLFRALGGVALVLPLLSLISVRLFFFGVAPLSEVGGCLLFFMPN